MHKVYDTEVVDETFWSSGCCHHWNVLGVRRKENYWTLTLRPRLPIFIKIKNEIGCPTQKTVKVINGIDRLYSYTLQNTELPPSSFKITLKHFKELSFYGLAKIEETKSRNMKRCLIYVFLINKRTYKIHEVLYKILRWPSKCGKGQTTLMDLFSITCTDFL